jgi:hypothetical protein
VSFWIPSSLLFQRFPPVGKGNDLHPVLLIASIIVGGHALGIIGMVIAVPVLPSSKELRACCSSAADTLSIL